MQKLVTKSAQLMHNDFYHKNWLIETEWFAWSIHEIVWIMNIKIFAIFGAEHEENNHFHTAAQEVPLHVIFFLSPAFLSF